MTRAAVFVLLALVFAVAARNNHMKPKAGHTDYGDFHRDNEHLLKDLDDDDELAKEKIADNDDMIYWFNLNDWNGDGKLDGHELWTAFEKDHTDDEYPAPMKELEDWVDHVLEEDDIDEE